MRIELDLNKMRRYHADDTRFGAYSFEVSSGANSTFIVNREQLILRDDNGKLKAGFDRRKSAVKFYGDKRYSPRFVFNNQEAPSVASDSLLMTSLGLYSTYHPVMQLLSSIEIFSIDPTAIRAYQSHDPGDLLTADGANLASVIKRIRREKNESAIRFIMKYIKSISPSVQDFGCETSGASDVLYLNIGAVDGNGVFKLYPSNISDGTLRALAILVALSTKPNRFVGAPRLMVIEEPEIALHPGAATVLMDAIAATLGRNQIIVTTHSPPLLDHPSIRADSLFGITMINGQTIVHGIDKAAHEALTESLFTAGELLQKEKLLPQFFDPKDKPARENMFSTMLHSV